MIPKNSKTSDSLRLGLNVTDKVNLKIIDKFVVSLNLSFYCAWRNIKVIQKQ